MDGDLSKNIAVSSIMREYFSQLQKEIDRCYDIAKNARKKGFDPEYIVEIPQALDLAARVEELVGPTGIAPKIRQATKKIGNRELVSLEIAKQIVNGKTYKFKKVEDALNQAIRTGLAILTEGVLVAPLEGIAEVKLGINKDRTNYVDLYFSGPIRSAGGTGQAMSVLIADVVRRELKIERYIPTSGEIERYKEEIPLYKRAQHLQYLPSVDEIDLVATNCPICINGEGTEDVEVTGYRDLPRVGTNRLRGGACLVIAEGLCLKAPKIFKHVKKLKLTGWEFLDIFINKGDEENKENGEIPIIAPSSKYIGEVIAGRPVFSHPSKKGGFRLRYGRARTAGLASTAINPAAMYLLDGFITVGTQMKTERPGKGTIGTPCDQIEGPIILLKNGDLIQINNVENVRKDVKKIIDLGEILIPFGEFIENNALLPDSSYVYEWWVQDLQKSVAILHYEHTFAGIKEADINLQKKINEDFGREIDLQNPSYEEAFDLSEKYSVPLHPNFNLFWHDIDKDDLIKLSRYVKEYGKIILNKDLKLVLPQDSEIKNILIELGACHKQREENLILDKYSYPLIRCCGLDIKDGNIVKTNRYESLRDGEDTLSLASKLSGITIRARALFRIGTRMGRPEKAAPRKMKPPPHVLFPLGSYGGNQRLFKTAAEKKKIEVEAGKRKCPKCNKTTYKLLCNCGAHTKAIEGRIETYTIDISEELRLVKDNIKERNLPDTIKGVIGTISKHKTPEPLEKGILRAKHNVHVFKDGTTRFDMTDAPLTHFKPKELGTSLERLKELGYTKDYLGNDLEYDEQICELKVQDVIISKSCAEYFVQVSKFVDDLLSKFYRLDRFYKIRKLQNLTGHLTAGLAPHTSAGALARIIGFTDTQVCYAHPFFHATKRRNCLSPNTNILTLNSEKPVITSMQDFYHETDSSEIIIDDFGTKQKTVEGISTFALNPQNGKYEIKKIKSVIKVKAPKHLLKIKLKSGRSFISSPSHRVVVWSNGKIVYKKMLEIQKDDKFFVSHRIDFCDKDVKVIDLLSEFSKVNNRCENVVIRGTEELVRKCVDKLGGLKCTSKKLELNKKTFSNYLYRNSIPLSTLLKLLELCHEKIDAIPRECMLGVKRDHTTIPRIIKVDETFMRLLGYYLSEGHARYTKKSCYQVGFACTEKDMRDDLTHCIKDVFDINLYKDKYGICVSNRLIHDFFVNILGIGKNAKNKRIPSRFIALPKHKMRELLRAYFSGDGSVEKDRLHVSCSSVDRDLLKDIGLQLLRFDIFYRLKEERKKVGGAAKKFYDKKGESPVFDLYYISIRSSYARKFCEKIGFSLKRKQSSLESVISKERKPRLNTFGNFILDDLKEVRPIKSDSEFLYDAEVEDLHNFPINDFVFSANCDGDEDGLMLLMDALLNFSHSYIPDKRGGRMDLPLILTTRIDPAEVDKEAHNIDTLARYPLDFYESTLKHEHSKNLEPIMGLVSARIGTDLQYEQLGFTHDTDDISVGPKESQYKTLKSMMDKMNVQLSLAAKIRAVDEADVAYKVIERHFLPDVLGNLRAFSKQSFRCPLCNTTYRRIPLVGSCTKCGGKLTLTVHEMSVKKYLDISRKIAEEYNLPVYARQRITLVEKSIDSLFESDKIIQKKIVDFF
jgi:DNA polymerase II large subunit